MAPTHPVAFAGAERSVDGTRGHFRSRLPLLLPRLHGLYRLGWTNATGVRTAAPAHVTSVTSCLLVVVPVIRVLRRVINVRGGVTERVVCDFVENHDAFTVVSGLNRFDYGLDEIQGVGIISIVSDAT